MKTFKLYLVDLTNSDNIVQIDVFFMLDQLFESLLIIFIHRIPNQWFSTVSGVPPAITFIDLQMYFIVYRGPLNIDIADQGTEAKKVEKHRFQTDLFFTD